VHETLPASALHEPVMLQLGNGRDGGCNGGCDGDGDGGGAEGGGMKDTISKCALTSSRFPSTTVMSITQEIGMRLGFTHAALVVSAMSATVNVCVDASHVPDKAPVSWPPLCTLNDSTLAPVKSIEDQPAAGPEVMVSLPMEPVLLEPERENSAPPVSWPGVK